MVGPWTIENDIQRSRAMFHANETHRIPLHNERIEMDKRQVQRIEKAFFKWFIKVLFWYMCSKMFILMEKSLWWFWPTKNIEKKSRLKTYPNLFSLLP